MDKVRFDINPHVIRQLGAELITDHITALMEIIKNSYDADASYVKVIINSSDKYEEDGLYYPDHAGYILIEDDGFGMDQETLLKSWLTISYSNKRAINGIKPKTPKGRTPLGDKGLGRLSTQRLAEICEIITKRKDSEAFHVGFNWSDFDSADRLGDVSVEFQPCNLNRAHGTRLLLLNIMDANYWAGSNLERFKASLCQLVAPYKELKPFNIFLNINGEDFYIDQEVGKLNQLSTSDIIYNYKDGVMSMSVGIQMRKFIGNDYSSYNKFVLADSGKRFLEYLSSDKKGRGSAFKVSNEGYWLTMHQEFRLADVCPATSIFEDHIEFDPGDFYGRIQEFSFSNYSENSDWWNNLYRNFDEYKSFVQNQIGIKIYRNGFAIRPYGIDEKDWLNLGKGQTTGSSYYGLRPGNVIGYIALDEAINTGLKDKTDREGLLENDYYINFRNLIEEVINRFNQEVENLRRCYNDFKGSVATNNTRVKSMKDAFDAISEYGTKGSNIADNYSKVQSSFLKIQDTIDKVTKEDDGIFTDDNTELYRKTLMDISLILSESKAILSDAQELLKNSSDLNEALLIIQPKLEALESQLIDFSELASLGLISEMVSHDLGQISNRMLGKSMEMEKELKKNSPISLSSIYNIIDFIKSTVSSIKVQIKHLDPSLKYSKEKKDIFYISEIIKEEEVPYYENKLRELGIELKITLDKDFRIRMNKGKLMQVLDNLINNSIYWLTRNNRDIMSPTINITISQPWVYFEDNGIGIDQSVENTLFEPFITRKPKGEGRGLGLFIIRQLLDDLSCDIVLDEIRNSFDNRYRFSINFHSVIE